MRKSIAYIINNNDPDFSSYFFSEITADRNSSSLADTVMESIARFEVSDAIRASFFIL